MTSFNDVIPSIAFRHSLPGRSGRLGVPIFLDFEGVLRTAHSEQSSGFSLARNFIAPLTAAEALGLDPLLVIASTYRHQLSVSALAQLLESEAPGLGRFVVSATPVPSSMNLDREQRGAYYQAPRLYEVRTWLEHQGMLGSPWIAVDDSPSLYGPAVVPQLIVCDPLHGFDAERARVLLERLRTIVPSLPPAPTRPLSPHSSSPDLRLE